VDIGRAENGATVVDLNGAFQTSEDFSLLSRDGSSYFSVHLKSLSSVFAVVANRFSRGFSGVLAG
jgi:hypothetical protein